MATDPARRPPTIAAAAADRWSRLPAGPASPWLHEEVGRRMEDRLQWIKVQPRHWADWSPLRGGLEAHARVAARYRAAAGYVIEPEPLQAEASRQALAAPWWSARRWQGARPSFAAPPEEGVDLLWANMALHMAADPQALITRWHRLVAVDGFLMFSCLGPDTLMELRALYQSRGWPPPSHEFTDMHDWGDMLVGAGFAEPVMDMERIVLTWSSADAALAELRGLGRNLHPARFAGLRGRGWRADLARALPAAAPAAGSASVGAGSGPGAGPSPGPGPGPGLGPGPGPAAGSAGTAPQPAGRIALTFEIIYGHAFKPAPKVALAAESAVSLREMRSMLARGRV